MKIKKIFEKGGGVMNEDQLLIENNLFAVFDGATSLNKFINQNGKTGGFLASFIAKENFSKNNKSLLELAESANKEINQEMRKNNIDTKQKENLWCSGFAAVRINKENFEWAQITDCLILVINNDNSFKVLVDNYNHDEENLIKRKKLGNISNTEKRKILFDDIIKIRQTQNINYGVLNGEKNMNTFIKSGSMSLENIKHIIIFTDGLIPPNENHKNPDDFDMFVKEYLEGGLLQVKNKFREMEQLDPECIRFPRFKQHDDIAAIAITL